MDAFAIGFGALVGVVLLLTFLSHFHVYQKLGMLFLFAWAASNVMVNLMGFADAPLMIPSLDAVVAILIAILGFRSRSFVALQVFALYLLVGFVHVSAFILHRQGSYVYYATLNVLFLLQLLLVGAASARMALVHWTTRRAERARAHPPRRQGLA